jgi:hypothetical protein
VTDEHTGEGAGAGGTRPEEAGSPPLTLEKGPPPGGGLRQASSAAAYRPGGASGPRAHRFWSARRAPAAVVAAVVLAGAVLLLVDVVSVRAGRPAAGWRRAVAGDLATRPLDDVWVRAGGAAAVLAGIVLLVLAAAPGLRRLLPVRRRTGEVRAGLDRGAAALVLRDRALAVPGVRSARVRVGRHRVRAAAVAHFRELDAVRGDLDAALEEGIRGLGLARQPALSVRVRRPSKG